MNNFFVKPLLYAGLLCLTAILPSCELLNPDGGEQDPEKTCRITGITTPWEEDIQYTYNAEGLLVTLKKGISLTEETESSTIHFSYDASKRIQELYDDHNQTVVYEYEENRLKKTRHYYGPVLQFTREYIRNVFGGIKEVLIYEGNGNEVFRKYTYTYDFSGNILQEQKYWTFNDSLKLVSSTLFTNYDNKKSIDPWHFLPGTLKMKNNPGKITHIGHMNGESMAVEVLTYQYNDKGYPVSLSYKHENEPAWNFTYQYADCQ